MKFARVPLAESIGKILAHNAHHGSRRILKKGSTLDAGAIDALAAAGHESVWTAELEPGDVDENTAADRIAAAICGPGVTANPAATGRTTLRAEARGVIRLLTARLYEINLIPGVTLAVVHPDQAVGAGDAIATIKIIPFALPEEAVAGIEAMRGDTIWVDSIAEQRIGLLVWGSEANRAKLLDGFRAAFDDRLAALGHGPVEADYVAIDGDPEAALSEAIGAWIGQLDVLMIAGESAIIDLDDLVPSAVRRAGAEVHWLGAPVFPGNLLLLARRDDCTVIGAPGCARSPARNVIDLLLPRLLTGEKLGYTDIIGLGYGGLLSRDVR